MPRHYHLVVGDGEIEAIEITPDKVQKAALWTGGVEVVEIHPLDKTIKFVALNFMTPDGIKRASEGHYVVKDALGNFSSMGPNEFHSKYKLINE